MNNQPSKPNVTEIVRRLRALRALTQSTGFSTNRSIGELLDRLSPSELITIGEEFLRDSDKQDESSK